MSHPLPMLQGFDRSLRLSLLPIDGAQASLGGGLAQMIFKSKLQGFLENAFRVVQQTLLGEYEPEIVQSHRLVPDVPKVPGPGQLLSIQLGCLLEFAGVFV